MLFIVTHTTPLKTVGAMYLLMVCKADDYPQVLGRYTHINQAVIVIFFISLHSLKARHKHTKQTSRHHTNTHNTSGPCVNLP